MKVDIFIDSGTPSLNAKFVNTNLGKASSMRMLKGLGNKDFSFLESDTYLNYREAYIDFLSNHKSYYNYCANLDIIHNPKESFANQKMMEKAGLKPIPVFHIGTDFKWLKRMLDRGHKFIALGGGLAEAKQKTFPILDFIWENYLTDKDGYPIVKVHGFGITAVPILVRYPWYSVDSSVVVMRSAYGEIIIPKMRDGKYRFDIPPYLVNISSKYDKVGGENNAKYFGRLTREEKDYILKYIDYCGFEMGKSKYVKVKHSYKVKENEREIKKGLIERKLENGLVNDRFVRCVFNYNYYLNLKEILTPFPRKFKIKSIASRDLFMDSDVVVRSSRKFKSRKLKFYLSADLDLALEDSYLKQSLEKGFGYERMYSFFYLSQEVKKHLKAIRTFRKEVTKHEERQHKEI